VFDGVSPNLNAVLAVVVEELQRWSMAGAKGISYLLVLFLNYAGELRVISLRKKKSYKYRLEG
jgi:hypothetical protein